jgi:hypothetical protein
VFIYTAGKASMSSKDRDMENRANPTPTTEEYTTAIAKLEQQNGERTSLKDGRLEIDNNRIERAIKPFVIGRKNGLFANTPRGAKDSAVIYSVYSPHLDVKMWAI